MESVKEFSNELMDISIEETDSTTELSNIIKYELLYHKTSRTNIWVIRA